MSPFSFDISTAKQYLQSLFLTLKKILAHSLPESCWSQNLAGQVSILFAFWIVVVRTQAVGVGRAMSPLGSWPGV